MYLFPLYSNLPRCGYVTIVAYLMYYLVRFVMLSDSVSVIIIYYFALSIHAFVVVVVFVWWRFYIFMPLVVEGAAVYNYVVGMVGWRFLYFASLWELFLAIHGLVVFHHVIKVDDKD